jgi:transcriptional regulator with GAF, ATPase, and Fis domain
VPVVVRGETGTGKELLAALLHEGSQRSAKPLVRFNCSAIVAELAESELFGHVRGAFTGANAVHHGYFERANGGTLVLDEVGELPERLQPKLLRALQFGQIQPVGSSKVEHVDVRVIACTHRDLAAEVKAGRFPEDLVTRWVALSEGGTLQVAALRSSTGEVVAAPLAEQGSFRAQVDALEHRLLTQALEEAQGNQSEAARRLALSRATFLDKLKRHCID